jgi:streptomycin 6-kinase
MVLKSASSQVQASFGEPTALNIWRGSPWVPELIAEYGDGISLREFIPGFLFSDLADAGCHWAERVGQALAELHVAPPAELPRLAQWMLGQREKLQTSTWLNIEQQQIAIAALDTVLAHPCHEVLLHGDLRPSNLIDIGDDIRLIDPYGYRGPAAFDLVSFAVSTPCQRLEDTLTQVVAGYQRPLVCLEETLIWFSLRHYDFLQTSGQPAWWLADFINRCWPLLGPGN